MKTHIAVFGGGCFWCTEAVFQMLKGVTNVQSGYAGGSNDSANYTAVSAGDTGHAEVIHIEYDPSIISYRDLLTVFFGTHDPTTENRQGYDVGAQYRSVIFYTTPEQEAAAKQFIAELKQSGVDVVTQVEALQNFTAAEEDHQDFYTKNKGAGYCNVIIEPKIAKVRKRFAELLKSTG